MYLGLSLLTGEELFKRFIHFQKNLNLNILDYDYKFVISVLFPKYNIYLKEQDKLEKKKIRELQQNASSDLYNLIKKQYPKYTHQQILERIRLIKLEQERRKKDPKYNNIDPRINKIAEEIIESSKQNSSDLEVNDLKNENNKNIFKPSGENKQFDEFEKFLFDPSYSGKGLPPLDGNVEGYIGKENIEGYTGI